MSQGLYTGTSRTTVYVWKPKYGSSVLALLEASIKREEPEEKDVGHAAMQVEDTYISVYPTPGSEPLSILNTPQLRKYTSYTAEKEGERAADFQETITWLNTDVMLAAWERMTADLYDFRLINCAGICKSLLIKGAEQSRVAEERCPSSFRFFENLTAAIAARDASTAEEIYKDYPSNTFFLDLMGQYANSNISRSLKAWGAWARHAILSRVSPPNIPWGVETYSTPADVIQIAEILKYYEDGKSEARFIFNL